MPIIFYKLPQEVFRNCECGLIRFKMVRMGRKSGVKSYIQFTSYAQF